MELIAENIYELKRIKSIKSVAFILLEWTIIISSIVLYIYIKNPLLLLILIPLISTRQYALYSLLHDGIHFLHCKNSSFNDLITRIFLAWPLFISLSIMRNNHFKHHKYLQTDEDPEISHLEYQEFKFPLDKKKFLIILLKDLLGYNFIKYRVYKLSKKSSYKNSERDTTSNLYKFFYYLSIIFFSIYFNIAIELLLLWVVPYATLYQALNRVRIYSEHFNIPDKSFKTRTLIINSFLAFFISPYNLGYHSEHHLYPFIPNYNLKKLHTLINNQQNNVIYTETGLKSLFNNIIPLK